MARFTVDDLTSEELEFYKKQKSLLRKECASEEEFNEAWKDKKNLFCEESVFNLIKNNRHWERTKDGRIKYKSLNENVKSIIFPKLGKNLFTELLGNKKGTLVKIRPCADKYDNKTYIGFLLGDIPTGVRVEYNKKNEEVDVELSRTNPAILVPELGEIIFGYESWWGEINSIEDLKEISDDDINNVWYVKLLKNKFKKDEREESKKN